MTGEIDIYGVLFPPLLVWLGLALILSAGVRFVLTRFRLYRFIWHRPLFDLAILIILTGCVAALLNPS
jgi:uncharacterized membrane protein